MRPWNQNLPRSKNKCKREKCYLSITILLITWISFYPGNAEVEHLWVWQIMGSILECVRQKPVAVNSLAWQMTFRGQYWSPLSYSPDNRFQQEWNRRGYDVSHTHFICSSLWYCIHIKLPRFQLCPPPPCQLWNRETWTGDIALLGRTGRWVDVTISFLCFSITSGWTPLKMSSDDEYPANLCISSSVELDQCNWVYCPQFFFKNRALWKKHN